MTLPADSQPEQNVCSTCWWYSSLSGDTSGYCYETEVVVDANHPACPEWDRNYPEKRKA